MRNLKRVLSLAMASIMLLGLMVVGAGAVSLNDFPDNEKVVNTEAVNTLTALSIIKGKDDGNFDPEGIVTRAEMAKMICVAYNGGNDPQLGNAATNTYTDTVGHWAAAYIEYCTNLGIVSGDNTGKFNPNATVTGVEAAKMLLVTIGYNAQVEKFVGAQWDMNVGVRANEKSLYDGLPGMNPSEGLTRDNAAQMIYNAIQAGMVTYTNAFVTGADGSLTSIQKVTEDVYPNTAISKTILGSKCGVSKWIGTLEGNTNSLGLPEKDQIRVHGKNETDAPGTETDANFPYTLANDLEWLGEEVCVLYKDSKSGITGDPDKKDTIFGVYNTGNTKVYHTTVSDIKNAADGPSDNDKIKFGGVEYKVATPGASSDVAVVRNYGNKTNITAGGTSTANLKAAFEGLSAAQNGDTVKFVANDKGEIVRAYLMESTLSYVTAVNNEKVSLNGVGAIKIADHDIYDGIAKNDVVVVTKMYPSSNEVVKVVEAETISGEVGGYAVNVASTSSKSVTLDGTTYKILGKAAMPTTVADKTGTAYFQTSDIGADYTLYLVNGMVGYAVKTSEDASQYALVTDLDSGALGSTFKAPQIQLLLSDGTKASGTVHKDSTLYSDASHGGSTVVPNDGTVAIDSSNVLAKGDLVKYSEPSDGVFKITEITTANGGTYTTNGTGSAATVYSKDLKAFAGTVTSGDCPLFVKNTVNSEYKAYNIRNLGDVSVANGTAYAYYVKDGKVVAAYAEIAGRPSGSTSNMFYGIVASSDGVVKVDGDYYNKYTVANNEDKNTVLIPTTGTGSGTLSGSAIVGFEKAADDTYNIGDIRVYAGTDYTDPAKGVAARVKEYSANDQTLTYWTAVTGSASTGFVGSTPATVALDNDCAIVYVNADDGAAGEDVGINAFDGVTGYRNVLIIKDDAAGSNKAVAVIVESSSNADILGMSLNLAAQTGVFTSGTSDSVTFALTVKGVAAEGVTPSISWYTDGTYATSGSQPTNLNSASGVAISSGASTLTFAESGSTVAPGNYYFQVSVTATSGEVITVNGVLAVAA